ncbi:DUF5652 family protein [Dehalobacter sp. DCM]|uniref:DUF5652 family protein n=1 Tax=Dehalobacter sp. DCM TaxID=2907827 RepID=UPI003081B05A|nr:DUF5652 family protein [Dehalobacter sp. DCM]
MEAISQLLLQPYSYLIYMAIAWALLWKGIALWYAARCGQLAWFIVLFLANTVSILEIIYVVFFRREIDETENDDQCC